jgi:hypothetical protein
MKISSYLLGLGAVASLVALNLAPANAQFGNGSDNGNTFTSITNVGGGGIVGGNGEPGYASASQSAVNLFSQSLTANAVGDAATFDVVNGAAPAALVATLLPTGVAADGATGKAATVLASTVQGMRSSNGNINGTKLNASVGAYNDYVRAFVSEVGPQKAVDTAPTGLKALQGLLGQLAQAANSASSAPAPVAPAPTAPEPVAPPVNPSAPPAPMTPPVPR